MKKHTKDSLHHALKSGLITIEVSSWNVRSAEHIASEWQLECPDGLFRRRVNYTVDWSRWIANPDWHIRAAGYVSRGHWRQCGLRQEEQLNWYFSEAHGLKLIKDKYDGNDKN